MNSKILVLCTGNSCRSQMAHGWLQSFDKQLQVYSAGTKPAERVNQKAVRVMAEAGIDISNNIPRNVSEYLNEDWDYVITVCDGAKELCPVFPGRVKHRLHMGFEDPSDVDGTEEYVLSEFRKVRDKIKKEFFKWFSDEIKR